MDAFETKVGRGRSAWDIEINITQMHASISAS